MWKLKGLYRESFWISLRHGKFLCNGSLKLVESWRSKRERLVTLKSVCMSHTDNESRKQKRDMQKMSDFKHATYVESQKNIIQADCPVL